MQTGCSFKLSTRRRIAGGIALAMIATLLVVAATTLAIRMTRQVEDRTERVSKTQARMERIRAALHAHAASQGRLPCPANGAQDTGLAVPVAAAVMCTHRDGTVPWVSLGLQAEDALDGWGHKISYRVPDSFVQVDSVKSSNSSTAGLKVKDYLVDRYKLAWVLISHGASGLGAWRVFLPQMALPGAGGNEWDNTQAAPVEFFRRGEALVDPATGVEYALNNAAHFDDVLLYESIEDLKNRSGFDLNTRMTTRRLDSGPGGKVTYTGRNANTASITFDSSTEWGDITVSSPGGNISRNAYGTGIGVCSGACNDDATAALDASKKLAFKLDVGKTAQKFSIGILSIEPTVEFLLTFKNGGIPVGSSVRVPLPPPPPALPDPPPPKPVELGKLVKFDYLQPNPPGSFNEVEIQPLGTSRFFIASIRFCTAAENCN
jgi:type II secretory pathway pseudopilin PulG